MTTSSNRSLPVAERRGASGRALRAGSRDAFTMIEIIIAISIVLVLAALASLSMTALMGRAAKRSTESRIERLKLHIDEYYTITGNFPPDGYDSKVENEEGMELRGSAALYHALSRPIEEHQMVGGVPRRVRHDPVADFRAEDLTPEMPEYPGVREIQDGWEFPLHYDNTLDGFSPQAGEAHYPPLDEREHPPDVRMLDESEGGVPRPGRPQSPGYDLWSHGPDGHAVDLDGVRKPPVASWNLKAKE